MKHTIILLLSIFFCLSAEAGNIDKDSLAFANADWKVSVLDGGAMAMSAHINMFDSQQSISILKYPSRKFRTRLIHSPGESAGKTSGIAEREGAEMAINGGYFVMKNLVPCVYFRIGKETFSQTSPSEAFRVNGVVGLKDRRGKKMMISCCSPEEYETVTRKWHSAMASGPMLIDDGEILVPEFAQVDASGKGVDSFNDKRHPRSVIGYDGKGNIFLVVIDGRHPGKGDGTSIYETALICRFLGMEDALNLDGGGSSALWHKETGVLSHPSDNKTFDHEGERAIPNIIGVYR
jgi:exopolysaccharide biosynthesis protein